MKSLFLPLLTCLGLSLQAFAQTGGAIAEGADPEANQAESLYAPLSGIQLPVGRDYTITESTQLERLLDPDTGEVSSLSNLSEDLSARLNSYEQAQSRPKADNARTHLRDVLIGFVLELIISIIVLQIAFSLIGFPSLFSQIALLSLTLAVTGAMMEYFLYIGLLNPIRIGLSFILLLLLIRQMTDVRDWATAIQIALLARVASIGLMWLGLAGSMAFLGL